MVGHVVTQPRVAPLARPALTRAGKTTLILLTLLGCGAIGGGLALVARPDGSVMHFDGPARREPLRRLPRAGPDPGGLFRPRLLSS